MKSCEMINNFYCNSVLNKRHLMNDLNIQPYADNYVIGTLS